MSLLALIGTNVKGETVYYTGKAGPEFISTNKADAFFGYNEEGIIYHARLFNRSSGIVGVTWTDEGVEQN